MSKEMRDAVEIIFGGPRFHGKLSAIVQRELGATLAPMIGPALVAAIKRELPDEFMKGMIDVLAGQRPRIPKKGTPREERDREIVSALIAGVPVAQIAVTYRCSERLVWRVKARLTDKLGHDVSSENAAESGQSSNESGREIVTS